MYLYYKTQLILNLKSISRYLQLKSISVNPTIVSPEIIFFLLKLSLSFSQKCGAHISFDSIIFFIFKLAYFLPIESFFGRSYTKQTKTTIFLPYFCQINIIFLKLLIFLIYSPFCGIVSFCI